MAIAGEGELNKALDEISRELRQLREATMPAEQLAWLHGQLEAGAKQILGNVARAFIVSPYALGNGRGKVRPIDYCTSEAALQECLELARRVRRERR